MRQSRNIRALCGNCDKDHKHLKSSEVLALLCLNNSDPEWMYTYAFQCPSCKVRSSAPISYDAFLKLKDIGCSIKTWYYPEIEMGEGPVISETEILEFCNRLTTNLP
jgi:hypothetical protein